MAISMDELMRAFGRPMNPSVQPVQDMRIQGTPAQPASAPMAAPMQAAPAPEPQQQSGLLGGFFGPEGRDARARLAIGLEGLTMRPNQALIAQLQQGIESRETAAQKNATAEWLRSRGREDLAAAMEGGLPAADALRIAMEPAAEAEIREVDGRLVSISPDGTVRELYGSAPTPDPQSAIAKLEADRRAGLINDEQYQAGLQALAPTGMTIESDGAGGFRMVQGAGVGAGGKPLTEAQSKFAVFQTDMNQAAQTINTLEETYDPTNLQDAASGVLGEKWGSFLQTPQGQIYRSAAYQWLDSGIRIRTGAAATTDEINRQYAAMFPQPGDLPETVDYKRRARENFMRSVDVALTNVRDPLAPAAPANVLEPSGNAPSGLSQEDLKYLE